MAADLNYVKLTNAAHEEGGVLHRNFKGIPHTGPFAGMGREDAAGGGGQGGWVGATNAAAATFATKRAP